MSGRAGNRYLFVGLVMSIRYFYLRIISAIILCSLLLTNHAFSEKIHIVHAQVGNPKEKLVQDILKLAIAKSDSDADYTYEPYHEVVNEARLFSLLNDGIFSVIWAGTQVQYEENFYPIRIPILKGLLGHRIFIIREGDQFLFDQVNTLAELQKIPLGQGRFWGDTLVLEHADMNIVAPVKYESLFYMLEGGRFDYFPRAVHELWSEVAARPELNLTVEQNILLIYPFAMYFFVTKENESLGKTIQTGFRNAIEDGSFDELFFNHPMIKDALKRSNLKKRKIFHLENPNMTSETPVEDKSLWLNIESDLLSQAF